MSTATEAHRRATAIAMTIMHACIAANIYSSVFACLGYGSS